MKVFVVVCLSLVLSVAVVAGDDFFESLDVEKLIKDETKMKAIYDCFFDRAPCGENQKFKDIIPEMVATDCSKCSPKAKANYDQGKKLALEKYPKEVEELLKKLLGAK